MRHPRGIRHSKRRIRIENVVLVGIGKKNQAEAILSSLRELQALTETAGGRVVSTLFQQLERYHPGTLIGEGKIAEVAREAGVHHARSVVFDEDLSPAQQKKLEQAIPAKILDRTRLILDIFAQRARTKEGELQVELAQLSYMLPRLTGRWRSYSQQVGGIGTRGPGERQLEYERRHIRLRIEYLKRAIERIKRDREIQRGRRASVPVPQVAIIGYTNVGKSTLLNALTHQRSVYADDKLFATLDPTTRRVQIPNLGWAVFTDTVGFIQKLPTALVAAFRSTLEEVTRADCLVHVLDGSASNVEAQKEAVERILKDLGAEAIPRIDAVNKIDRLSDTAMGHWREELSNGVFISAKNGQGISELFGRIQTVLESRWLLRELEFPPEAAGSAQEAYRCSQVIDQSYHHGRIRLKLRITPENWSRLQSRLAHHGHSSLRSARNGKR